MSYSIRLTKEADAEMEALYEADRRLFKRILAKIESLAERPREGKPLVGNHKGEFSLWAGCYRIVYELDTARHIVYILTVKYRKHVY